MANVVEIVITSKNKARPGIEEARKDAKTLGESYKHASATARGALAELGKSLRVQVRDAAIEAQKATRDLEEALKRVRGAGGGGGGGGGVPDPVEPLRRKRGPAEKEGRTLGQRVAAGLSKGLLGALKAATLPGLVGVLGAALKGAFSSPIIGTVVGAAAVVIGTALAAGITAALAGSLVLGVGGLVTGIGVALLAQNDKVKKAWKETWKDLQTTMTDAARPLLPVMETARKQVKSVVEELAPAIQRGFEVAQGPMQRFVEHLGDGFKRLEPAIEPLFLAFGAILDQMGPELPAVFERISDSFARLANVAIENKDLIAGVFLLLLDLLPTVVNFIADMVTWFRNAAVAGLDFADTVLSGVQSVVEAMGNLPGLEDWAASASASIQTARESISRWKHDLETAPKIARFEADITGLDAKIARARAQLKDPNLTKSRRARLEADIQQLLAAKARAQAAIDSLRGKTVSVYLTVQQVLRATPGVSLRRLMHAHGGNIGGLGTIKGFQSGGVSGAGSALAVVGEQGPELVRLPVGSTVIPAGQSASMMSATAARAASSISMAFRASAPKPVESSADKTDKLIQSLRDMVKELRQIVTLREGMSRFTDLVMGQARAFISYEAALDRAAASLKKNGKTLNIGREKGRENRSALLDLAQAAHEAAFAMADLGRPISAIVARMKEQRAEFIRMARAFGLSAKQAKALADRYGLVPSQVKAVLTKQAKDVKYNKAAEKYNKALEKQIAALQGRAAGGPAGGLTLVGEQGPELVRLPWGASVVPAGATAQALTAGGGGGRVVLEVHSGGSRLDDLLVEVLRKAVRVRGGNVQLVLGRA